MNCGAQNGDPVGLNVPVVCDERIGALISEHAWLELTSHVGRAKATLGKPAPNADRPR